MFKMQISKETALTVLKAGNSLVLNSLNHIAFPLSGNIPVDPAGRALPAHA